MSSSQRRNQKRSTKAKRKQIEELPKRLVTKTQIAAACVIAVAAIAVSPAVFSGGDTTTQFAAGSAGLKFNMSHAATPNQRQALPPTAPISPAAPSARSSAPGISLENATGITLNHIRVSGFETGIREKNVQNIKHNDIVVE